MQPRATGFTTDHRQPWLLVRAVRQCMHQRDRQDAQGWTQRPREAGCRLAVHAQVSRMTDTTFHHFHVTITTSITHVPLEESARNPLICQQRQAGLYSIDKGRCL